MSVLTGRNFSQTNKTRIKDVIRSTNSRFGLRTFALIRQVKHDVSGKRQTAKMNLLSLFSTVFSRVKLFAFAMNRRRRFYIYLRYIYGLEEKNSESEVIFCRLPSVVNVMLNLPIVSAHPYCARKFTPSHG